MYYTSEISNIVVFLMLIKTVEGRSTFDGFLNLEYRFYGKIILAILLMPVSICRYKNKQRLYI